MGQGLPSMQSYGAVILAGCRLQCGYFKVLSAPAIMLTLSSVISSLVPRVNSGVVRHIYYEKYCQTFLNLPVNE